MNRRGAPRRDTNAQRPFRTRHPFTPLNLMHFETAAIHVGQAPDPHSGAVIPPLSLSTTFAQRAPGEPIAHYDYSRSSNPTRESLEQCVAALEAGTDAVAFASGLAATTTLIHLLQAGDHVVCIDDVYGGTQRYFRQVALRAGAAAPSEDADGVAGDAHQPHAASDRYRQCGGGHPVWGNSGGGQYFLVTLLSAAADARRSHLVQLHEQVHERPFGCDYGGGGHAR
eukprot:ctg_477.g150